MKLPSGWRIVREVREDVLRGGDVTEVAFTVYGPDNDEMVARPRAAFDSRWGEWIVTPGSTSNRMEPDEARARAQALVQAAGEAERRNRADN